MTTFEMAQREQLPYYGGNGVLFSLLDALLGAWRRSEISHEAVASVLRGWGAEYAQKLPTRGSLEEDLEALASLLPSLGLVRLFEPDEDAPSARDILVMRCSISRYVRQPVLQNGAGLFRILPLFVAGFLRAKGHAFEVVEKPGSSMRRDEFVLSLQSDALGTSPSHDAPRARGGIE